MKILVIGSGGREHAIIERLLVDDKNTTIFCSPSIDAIDDKVKNLSISVSDTEALMHVARDEKIDLTIVGPEAPLVDGIVDLFEANGLPIFGPSKAASQLEASKSFSKEIMRKYQIPTASYESFRDYDLALAYVEAQTDFPIVIKASGLAAGKGVVIPETKEEALRELKEIMYDKKFGSSGDEVVIEEFMQGEETSIFAICDGENFVSLSPAQDHKRIGEGDTGKNTGGMGAYAPASVANPSIVNYVENEIIKKLLAGMKAEGKAYKGVLFCGLMIQDEKAKVVEFNVRFGDPETQVVLPLIKSNFTELLLASVRGDLKSYKLELEENTSFLTVVMASGAYPDSYEKGFEIHGTDRLSQIKLLHAGTKREEGKLVTNAGRVLNFVSSGQSLKEARDKLYQEIDTVYFKESYYRKDIAYRELNRQGNGIN